MTTAILQLIPDEESKAQPLFKNDQEYQEFRVSLQKEIQGELDSQNEARRQSEEQAKKLMIG